MGEENFKQMKIAVTGANGHVGANLVRFLLEQGHSIRVLVHRNSRALQGLAVEVVKGSLSDTVVLEKLCRDREVVFHAAAQIAIGSENETDVFHTNVTGTKNVLRAAEKSGVKRFIHFSSIHALQQQPLDKPVDENRPLNLDSPWAYEKSKALAEKWVLERNAPDFQVIVLNPTAIIGPYDFGPSYLGQVMLKIYQGRLPGLVPGGYNWVDVRDVAQAAVNALEKGVAGERYLLAGHWHSLKTLAEIICNFRNKKCRLPVFPFWMARAGVPFLTVLARLRKQMPLYTQSSLTVLQLANRQIDNGKAVRELGFRVRPLRESVADTVEWFKKHQYL
jgi:dihydroflavonol-4-reductase